MLDMIMAMDPVVFAAFAGAAVLLYLTPGADMMFTIASGAAGGARAGLAAAAGVSLGTLTHVLAAAAGLAVLVAASPVALDVIRYGGAAYLLWLAWNSWFAPSDPGETRGRTDVWRAFRRGYLTNILNPKVALFILAFLPQFTDPAIGPVGQQMLALGFLLVIGGMIALGTIGFFSGFLAERIRAGTGYLNKLAAIVFGGLAARLALT